MSNLVIDQMNVIEIADYIDMNFHESSITVWTGKLLFPSSINDEQCTDQNILQFVDSKNHKQTKKRNIDRFKVYLNPIEYPSSEGYESEHFQKLSKDFSTASLSCGSNVVRNGTRPWKCMNLIMIRFICCRYRKFRGYTRLVDNDQYNFHQHDYRNDHKLRRGR